jgi:hypothetical protein
MIDLLKRHEIQVLRRAGHSLPGRHLSSILCLTSSRGLLEAAVEDRVHLVE